MDVAEEYVPPNGFLRLAPLAATPLPLIPFDCGAGDPAGLALGPIFRVILEGASGILSLIFGPAGSGTACFASLSFLEKKVYIDQLGAHV